MGYVAGHAQFSSRRCRMLLPLVALAMSACQTTENGAVGYAWRSAAPAPVEQARLDDGRNRGEAGSTGLRGGEPNPQTAFFEGSGRFIGEQRAAQQPSAGEETVTINLVNVPAPQAAKTILGDLLAVRYTVDPGIEGKITIQTPKPVAKSTAVDLFQSALRANGAAVIETNGMYRIVPIDQAAVGASIRVDGAEAGERLGSGVEVVQLKYVAASEMRRILEPIAPRGGLVRADDTRNTLTLSGNRQDIAGMLDAIALFDVDVMKGMSFALVPVKTSQPQTIADELRRIFASEREGPMAGMVQFLPNKRLAAILVISPQPKYLARAADWVRRLDAQAEGSEKQFFTYAVQNRQAQELVDVLRSMFSKETGARGGGGGGRNVAPQYREANLQSSRSQPSFGGGSFGSGGGSPQSLPVQSAAMTQPRAPPSSAGGPDTAPAQAAGEEGADEPRIKLAADEAKNAILIEATPADYRRLMRVVGSLDQMPNQVLIEATIAEISLNDDLKFGLRWYLQRKGKSYTFTDDASGAISSVFPGFSYALKAVNIAATLNALNEITSVNVISSPSLMAMDNRTAFLQIGDQVPITTQSAVSVLGIGAPVVNSVSYRDTGVILAITPRINDSGRVLLDIEQEVSTVAATTSSNIDSPTIRQRRIRTSVVLNNGEGLALGGLIQDSRTVSRTQIPILGDIPLLGNAWKHKDNQIGKTELIILIAPHVVRNLNEARSVTDEFRRELAIYVPYDRHQPRSIEQTIRRTFE